MPGSYPVASRPMQWAHQAYLPCRDERRQEGCLGARHRYSKLVIEESDLYEYVFYVSISRNMGEVMHGLAAGNGCACPIVLL